MGYVSHMWKALRSHNTHLRLYLHTITLSHSLKKETRKMENIQKINYHDTKFIDENGDQQTIKIPVVQDLARLKTLPENFIQNPVAAHPFASNSLFDAIDIAKLRVNSDPGGRAIELRKLGGVCREWGMFTIRNHGMDPGVVEEVVKKFFELPFEEEKSSVGTYMNVDNMGYGRNFMKSHDQPLDWIDRLTMKAAPVGATDGLHVWPNNPPNFRPAIENYVKVAREVVDEILKALAEAISVDTHSFSNTSEISVRINYYPSCPRPDLTMGLDATQFGSNYVRRINGSQHCLSTWEISLK